MVSELIRQGYGNDMDLNCSEKILYAANQAYNLGLTKDALKMAAGFGGGMAIEETCGALTGAIMALGVMFVENRAHESTRIKELTKELFERYKKEMGTLDCEPLKSKYRIESTKCYGIILKAAEILDDIVKRETAK